MPEFSVVPAKIHHCGLMARLLRDDHRAAVTSLGHDTHSELRKVFADSSFRRAWLINGKLAALGGVTGSILEPVGMVWLALSRDVLRYRLAIVKEARRQLAEIMVTKRELATTIVPTDAAALRLAIFLGFHVGHDDEGDVAQGRAARQRLASHIAVRPQCRVPFGSGHLILMGYHQDTR